MNIYSIKISPNRPFNKSELTYLTERCTILSKKVLTLDYIKECDYDYDEKDESFTFNFLCIHNKTFSLKIVKDDRSDNHFFSMQKYDKWSILRKDFIKELEVIHELHSNSHN
ncbi:hypothetical protein [Candidatus Enterococcus clewellii]|uniref:Uncharacterized protein n=1 Tax=Candidatus Enterococcus clewellii TaxID=1834193 RepID=A0A242K3N0_9ENTE|nr:hypothetical protein [Enterococcus sp. 9E7_DIV0242]OTP13511.1 hypothetical protein A5888_002989 [Enterococcus sp. 9E7_DIV0242]